MFQVLENRNSVAANAKKITYNGMAEKLLSIPVAKWQESSSFDHERFLTAKQLDVRYPGAGYGNALNAFAKNSKCSADVPYCATDGIHLLVIRPTYDPDSKSFYKDRATAFLDSVLEAVEISDDISDDQPKEDVLKFVDEEEIIPF